MFNKPIDQINIKDIESLKENKIPEKRRLEYKLCLPGNKDRDKIEFLADVSSFANAAGGYILYGIKEDGGIITDIAGLESIDSDNEIQRLNNMILTGIKPRIYGLEISPPITIPNSHKVIILIHIPKSWALPHVVSFEKHWRFYTRDSNGKHPLDIDELRSLFALSETTGERIRNFRMERLGKIISGEMPIPIKNIPKIVIHLIPFGAFDFASRYDLSSLDNRDIYQEYKDFDSIRSLSNQYQFDYRFNFDGIIAYKYMNDDEYTSYIQIFRNGIVECVHRELKNAITQHIIRPGTTLSIEKGFDIKIFQDELSKLIKILISYIKIINTPPPFFVMLSLLGFSGYQCAFIHHKYTGYYPIGIPIKKNELILPDIEIEDYESDIKSKIQLPMDIIWNACGLPPNPDDNKLQKIFHNEEIKRSIENT